MATAMQTQEEQLAKERQERLEMGREEMGREDGRVETLDLPSIVADQSLGEKCIEFFVDTTVVYVYGMTRLAVAQLVIGAVCIGLGLCLFLLNGQEAWSGVGIWGGIPVFVAGAVCMYYRRKRPHRKVYFHSAACLLSITSSAFLIVSSGVNILIVGQGLGDSIYPNYTKQLPGDRKSVV